MTDQLKPCPAGHNAEIVQHPDGITYSPKCADWNCAWGIDEEFSDPTTATRFWNTRPQDAEVERLRARVAELEEDIRRRKTGAGGNDMKPDITIFRA